MTRLRPHPLLLLLFAAVPVPAQASPQNNAADPLAQRFRAAYTAYQAGQYADASARLQALETAAPASFEVHELLGMVYAAQAQDTRAIDQFQQAAMLDPHSAAAMNNLATALIHAGKTMEAEVTWQKALKLEPADYSASRNLAKLYLEQGKAEAALPLLLAARSARPDAKENKYDLALAYLLTKRPEDARRLVEDLLRETNSGELHGLLGRIDEEQAKYVEAANEFASAAYLEPSEDNLFAWGSELLLHRAYEPAIAVFQQATVRYPQAPRLWVGLGMSLYSRGEYEPSVHALMQATDLNAQDPRCYLFLSKAYLSSPSQAEAVIERFHHYAEMKPADAMAQYYCAMSLWKGRRLNAEAIDFPKGESLLQRSVALDATNAEVHLELGILYSDQHEEAKKHRSSWTASSSYRHNTRQRSIKNAPRCSSL